MKKKEVIHYEMKIPKDMKRTIEYIKYGDEYFYPIKDMDESFDAGFSSGIARAIECVKRINKRFESGNLDPEYITEEILDALTKLTNKPI